MATKHHYRGKTKPITPKERAKQRRIIGMSVFFGILTFLITVPLIKITTTLGGLLENSYFNISELANISALYAVSLEVSTAFWVTLPVVVMIVMMKEYMKSPDIHVSGKDMLGISLVFSIVFSVPYGLNLFVIFVVYLMSLIGCLIGEWTAHAMLIKK